MSFLLVERARLNSARMGQGCVLAHPGWEGENKRAVKQVGPLLLIIFD